MYRKTKNGVYKTDEGIHIPEDKNNYHFKQYLIWVEKGGVLEVDNSQFKLLKQSVRDKLLFNIKQKRYTLAGTKDDTEIASWPNKMRMALSLKDKTISANERNVLSQEIKNRLNSTNTITDSQLIEFCNRIIDKSEKFSLACARLDGIKKRLLDELDTAESEKALIELINSYNDIIAT